MHTHKPTIPSIALSTSVLLAGLCAGARSDSPVLKWPGNGHSYQLVETQLLWTEARAAAETRGGYLATINSAEESQWVLDSFVAPAGKIAWIGLYQDEAPYAGAWGMDEHWNWVTGEPVTFTNWRQNEPNDQGALPARTTTRTSGT